MRWTIARSGRSAITFLSGCVNGHIGRDHPTHDPGVMVRATWLT
jgi:hypothetical protein